MHFIAYQTQIQGCWKKTVQAEGVTCIRKKITAATMGQRRLIVQSTDPQKERTLLEIWSTSQVSVLLPEE